VVLLGDSIFDNQAYVPGEPDVIAQLRQELGPEWRATLLAVDGDTASGVVRQLGSLPEGATHLVVSVGGNDALGFGYLLEERAGTVGEALRLLATAQQQFAAVYQPMAQAVCGTRLPTAFCTIYDTPPSGPGQPEISTAVAIFNDIITRAALAHSASLIDLRLICSEDADYANPIEPSSHGGRKIAKAIAGLLLGRSSLLRSTSWATREQLGRPPGRHLRFEQGR
jgi:lysophospholipase L1-like esterase